MELGHVTLKAQRKPLLKLDVYPILEPEKCCQSFDSSSSAISTNAYYQAVITNDCLECLRGFLISDKQDDKIKYMPNDCEVTEGGWLERKAKNL